jgi:hypothetical protein
VVAQAETRMLPILNRVRSCETVAVTDSSQGSDAVNCYLCAYKRPETPSAHHQLPAGSPAGANDELGGCWKCNVWACSTHGTRYGQFECAICTPASAATSVLVATPVAGAAATRAYNPGARANSRLRTRVVSAVNAVLRDSRRPQEIDARALAAPQTGNPNLVTNLADVIREHDPGLELGLVPATQDDGQGRGITSVDVIGGAVREQFTGVSLVEPDEHAITIVTGALLLGYALADDPTQAQRTEDGYGGWSTIEYLPPPWRVTHPVLLDPVLWMLGTAMLELR